MSDLYYCNNSSCLRREDCIRTVQEYRPLRDWHINHEQNNYLHPFYSGNQKETFSPDNRGYCNSFIESPNSKRLKDGGI